jgi:hypothetical protein
MPALREFRTLFAPRVAVVSTIVILYLFVETHNYILSEFFRVNDEAVPEICMPITHTWETRLEKERHQRHCIFKRFAGSLETCSSPGEYFVFKYIESTSPFARRPTLNFTQNIPLHYGGSASGTWTGLLIWVPVRSIRIWRLLAAEDLWKQPLP